MGDISDEVADTLSPPKKYTKKRKNFLKGCGLESLQEFSAAGEATELPWDQLPQLVHPQAGQLPPDR